MKKKGKSMPPRIPGDPNSYWFFLQPLPPFDVKYTSNKEAKAKGMIGPFSFREFAECERVDRLVSGKSCLKLIPGGKKEAP